MRAFFQKLALSASLLLGTLSGSPAVYALDPARLIPPGHFIDLGTHRLYYECMGTGRPAVLIDYGIGSSAIAWRDLHNCSLCVIALSITETSALVLALTVHGVNAQHFDAENCFDCQFDLCLVRRRCNQEGVLVLIEQAIGLLRNNWC